MPKIFFPSSKPVFIDAKNVIKEFRAVALKTAKHNARIKAVYLFGSYARGNPGLHSDADILVVLSHDSRRMIDRMDEFILEFSGGPVPADVLVYTKKELEEAIRRGNRFLARAVREGIRLV
ncbi:MAG: nucleotidyltransferase domain-containing protein [Candidatus Omnitrophota bacterium]